MAEPRKYLVTFWLFASGSAPEDRRVVVPAYDARDAEYQAGIYPRQFCELNKGYHFRVRSVEPAPGAQS